MYKKYCLIANIVLIIPVLTTAMEVEKIEQKQIYIQTNDGATLLFSPNSTLFTKSAFLKAIILGKLKEKGTATYPIILQTIDRNQLLLINKFILKMTDSERLKQYLKTLDVDNLNQLIVAGNFLGVQGIFKPVAPYLIKQLQDPDVLNAWLNAGWNELLAEYEELSDHMKHHLVPMIKPILHYLEQKKSIPSDVLTGHKRQVFSVAFSPDGTILASGSEDRTIKLWDVKTGTEILTLTWHDKPISSVAFSPDGTILASGSWDGAIKLWDVKTGTEILTLGHDKSISSVAFSPDGTILAAGLGDYTIKQVKLWNVKTGTEIGTLIGDRGGSVTSVVFSPDGTILAAGSADHTIKLWNVKTGTQIGTLTGHDRYISSVAFSPDGTMLASGSWDHTIKLWDVKTGIKIRTTRHWNSVSSVTFSPDGTILVSSGSSNETINFWDVKTGTQIGTLTGHKGTTVYSLEFNPDGTILASGSGNPLSGKGAIRLWHLIDLQEIEQLSTLELLLIYAWQHTETINLEAYPELNTFYNQISDLAKTFMPQKTWWRRWLSVLWEK